MLCLCNICLLQLVTWALLVTKHIIVIQIKWRSMIMFVKTETQLEELRENAGDNDEVVEKLVTRWDISHSLYNTEKVEAVNDGVTGELRILEKRLTHVAMDCAVVAYKDIVAYQDTEYNEYLDHTGERLEFLVWSKYYDAPLLIRGYELEDIVYELDCLGLVNKRYHKAKRYIELFLYDFIRDYRTRRAQRLNGGD